MKVCNRCLETKDLTYFYKHPAMPDGYLNQCKECKKKQSMEHLDSKRDKINLDRRLARAKVSGKFAEYSQAYRDEKGEQNKALQCVYRAVKSGKLIRPLNCSICNKNCKTEAHHWSYEVKNWLNVIWLCRSCHRNTHINKT